MEARNDLQKILSMVKELEPALSGDDGRNSSKSNSVERPGAKDQKLHQLESIKDQKHPLPQENKESDLIFSKSKKFIIKKPYYIKFEKFQSEAHASFLIQI